MVWDGLLSIKVTELHGALKRKSRKSKDREKKKCYGTSISDRPEIAAIRIPGKTSKAVMDAMAALRAGYGQHFPQVFKTITVDNGSEFAGFAQAEHGTARFSLPTLIPHGSVPRTRGHPCSC